jgi:hypothetical protein
VTLGKLKCKGKPLHLILLTRLNFGISVQSIKPTKELLKSSYYINNEYSISLSVDKKNRKKTIELPEKI